MLCSKKVNRSELLHFALILSLLRGQSDYYFENDPYLNGVSNLDLGNGTLWRSYESNVLRAHYVYPKNFDSLLLNYEREVFSDLNALGRHNRIDSIRHQDVTAYLVNVNVRGDTPQLAAEPFTTPQPSEESEETSSHPDSDSIVEAVKNDTELTQEDIDLIEVLWQQDVDLGFSLEIPGSKTEKQERLDEQECPAAPPALDADEENSEKLEALVALNNGSLKPEPENDTDVWDTHRFTEEYTIDTETGEYVVKTEEPDNFIDTLTIEERSCDLPIENPSYLPLIDVLQLIDLDDDPIPEECVNANEIENLPLFPEAETATLPPAAESALPELSPILKDNDSEEDLYRFCEMIQTPQYHHPHNRAFQSRIPFVRTGSMEQRWQDLANLLSLSGPSDASSMPHPFSHHPLHNYSHHHSHSMSYGPDSTRGVLLHNATLTPPMGDINGTGPYSSISGTNLGSAVATSMNLTNSSEPMNDHSSAPHYKLEPSSHDMLYYQHGASEMNQTDGFLSSILNDEDLQLMDMAMNEGMYTMRMLDSNNAISNISMNSGGPVMSRADVDRMDVSNDSAVSSMGSERVPSLSDGEWCDAGSDSGHTNSDQYVVDYQTNKYRPYDYSYTSRQPHGAQGLPPVAQKKHQMFGKRYFQEQGVNSTISHPSPTPIKYEYRDATPSFATPSQAEGAVGPKPPEMKYSCSMNFGRHHRAPVEHVQHNHTYHLPAEGSGSIQRPLSRDKVKKKSEEEHLTRDEKRARALNVPMCVDDIINLPMDEFNERLSKYDLSEPQLSLIRDIRRRGKNKVAAQNCRKRKLDQITSLADEVKDMRDRKVRLLNEHEFMIAESQRVKDKFTLLYRHVFQNLRDPDGNQYSPYQYSLQQSADGSILVVPRANSTSVDQASEQPSHLPQHKE